MQTLTLQIPPEIYVLLNQQAQENKVTIESLVLQWVLERAEKIQNDPLLKLAGIFKSGIPDLADKHDEYIGEVILNDVS